MGVRAGGDPARDPQLPAVVMVLGAWSIGPEPRLPAPDWLWVGEATGAIQLIPARDGLASSPLTQPREVEDTRHVIRSRVAWTPSTHPQIPARLGWAPVDAPELPLTPRRPPDDVVARLGGA
jgi:hypothetical protein